MVSGGYHTPLGLANFDKNQSPNRPQTGHNLIPKSFQHLHFRGFRGVSNRLQTGPNLTTKSSQHLHFRGPGGVPGGVPRGSRAVLGSSGASKRPQGPPWGRLGAALGRPGVALGRLGAVLGSSWGRLGSSWARLGAVWRVLGGPGGPLGASWSRPGAPDGGPGRLFWVSGCLLLQFQHKFEKYRKPKENQ